MSNDRYPYSPAPAGHWGPSLIITCLALGFTMSWGSYELRYRLAETDAVDQYRHQCDLLAARQSDIGRLLSDPRTKFIRLTPAGSASPAMNTAVAWNPDRHSGVVFCDTLSAQPSRRYQIWLIPPAGDASAPTAMSFGPTEPGQAVYLLNTAEPTPAPGQIILTLWTATQKLSDAPPALAHATVE